MIPAKLQNRLEKVAKVLENRFIQYPFIFQKEWETREDIEAKLERWKAGEKVDGIAGEYEGGEVGILLPFQFVSPPARKVE